MLCQVDMVWCVIYANFDRSHEDEDHALERLQEDEPCVPFWYDKGVEEIRGTSRKEYNSLVKRRDRRRVIQGSSDILLTKEEQWQCRDLCQVSGRNWLIDRILETRSRIISKGCLSAVL